MKVKSKIKKPVQQDEKPGKLYQLASNIFLLGYGIFPDQRKTIFLGGFKGLKQHLRHNLYPNAIIYKASRKLDILCGTFD